MKISIIVPHYHETIEEMNPLFESLRMQRLDEGDFFEVIIVNDGDDYLLSTNDLDAQKLPIKYFVKAHEGVSSARNCGLDNSDGEVVMFCDADDCFYHARALGNILATFKNSPSVNCLWNNFIEEQVINGQRVYIARGNNFVYIHGKAYRRSFLNEHGIRFDPEIYYHEDTNFNAICMAYGGASIVYIEEPYYIWCWNSNSITRRGESYLVSGYPQNILSVDKAIERVASVDTNTARSLISSEITQSFFVEQHEHAKDISEELRNFIRSDVKPCVKAFYKKYEETFSTFTLDEKYNAFCTLKPMFDWHVIGDTSFNDFLAWENEVKSEETIACNDIING